MARETRRQRRDARRAAGEESPARPTPRPVPAGETAVAIEHPRRGGFIRESIAELRKVEWPTQAQLIQGVVVVLIACIIVGVFLYTCDLVFKRLVQQVFT